MVKLHPFPCAILVLAVGCSPSPLPALPPAVAPGARASAPIKPAPALPVPLAVAATIPHREHSHFTAASRSDGTPFGDRTMDVSRWSRIAGLMQAATSTDAATMPGDQAQLWQTEIALYTKRIEDLQADLAALDSSRPALLAQAVQRRLDEDGSLHHVAADTEARIAAGRAPLLELLDGYQASLDDRQALLTLVATLPRGPAQERAETARAKWLHAVKALESLR